MRAILLALVMALLPLLPRAADAGPRYCDHDDIIERTACLIVAAGKGAAARQPVEPFWTAIEAMNVVRTLASSARYNLWKRQPGFEPPATARVCLARGYGICGNHVELYLTLAEAAGIEARPVQFWYGRGEERASHAAVEVRLAGEWRYLDVTWGSFWLADAGDIATLLPLDDVLAGRGERVTARTDVWYLAMTLNGADVWGYLKADPLDVTRDGAGRVRLAFDAGDREVFAHRPNYIGDNVRDGRRRRMYFELTPEAAAFGLELYIAAVSGCENSMLSIGGNHAPLRPGKVRAEGLTPGAVIEIVGDDDLCYAVFERLTLLPAAD